MATTTTTTLPTDGAAVVLAAELRGRIDGEVRFDPGSRMLYATDASLYQIEPIGVVIPRHADVLSAALTIGGANGVASCRAAAARPVGADGRAGLGHRLLQVHGPDRRSTRDRWARVEPGIVLDLLNAQLSRSG